MKLMITVHEFDEYHLEQVLYSPVFNVKYINFERLPTSLIRYHVEVKQDSKFNLLLGELFLTKLNYLNVQKEIIDV